MSDDLPPDPFGPDDVGGGASDWPDGRPGGHDDDRGPAWHPSQGPQSGAGAPGAGGPGPGDPFAAAFGFLGPMFGDLAKMLSAQQVGGSLRWDTARQIAQWAATEGATEPNVDPLERMRLEQLARVAEMHVSEVGGLEASGAGRGIAIVAVTRAAWAGRFLDEHRPLLEALASLTATPPSTSGANPARSPEPPPGATDGPPGFALDPQALLNSFMGLIQPALVGLQVGSMAGHLARRSFSSYDLPLPRAAGDQLVVVPANLNEFAGEWSLEGDSLRMRVLLAELAHHAVLRLPHVNERFRALLHRYVSSYSVELEGLESRLEGLLGGFDPSDPSAMAQAFGDPAAMLESVTTPAQREIAAETATLVAAIEGWVGHVVGIAAGRLLGDDRLTREALRRRRVTATNGDRMVERMLGLSLDQPLFDRGKAFVDGVLERAGDSGLARLWSKPEHLPTANELAAPGLWLARIEL